MTSSKGRGHHLQGYSLNCHTGRAMGFCAFCRGAVYLSVFSSTWAICTAAVAGLGTGIFCALDGYTPEAKPKGMGKLLLCSGWLAGKRGPPASTARKQHDGGPMMAVSATGFCAGLFGLGHLYW